MKKLNISSRIGLLGENIAKKYMVSKGYTILVTNYLEKTGEIDIIAKKRDILYFCEVKSRSVATLDGINAQTSYAFNNIHPLKLKRLQRTVQLYLIKQNVTHETSWQIDVVGVYIDENEKKAKVVVIENVV